MTSSWFFLPTLNYDARSTTHQMKYHFNLTRKTGTSHEDQHTFMTISHSVLLCGRNVSGARCIDNQNMNFMFTGFFFDSLEYFIDIKSFRSHYGPGVDSASNRNEYREHFLGGKGGRCVSLTTLPPSCTVVM